MEHVHVYYSGGWDTEGVTVVEINPINSTITCNSSHLTSFAVLVDVSGGYQVCMYVHIRMYIYTYDM